MTDQFTKPTITIDELKAALSERAYGILLLVLALPNLIPIPTPGLSTVLGAPLVLVTFQLMLGMESPWFPKFISQRSLKTDHVRAVCNRIVPPMRYLERFITPRLLYMTAFPADRMIACVCVILSLMIMMPLPFGNAFPGLAICLFAIGIMQRDGLFIIAGIFTTLISATVIIAFLSGILLSVSALLGV